MTPLPSRTVSASSHGMFAHPRQDIVAGTVVFLVALPLCLGIAVACGMPPVTGLIAGIAGGLVTPWLSRSAQSVTGPAAGLTSIVLLEGQRLGMAGFLTAVVAAGLLQLVLGSMRAGRVATLVPSSVIKGMLAAIGITIVVKQVPVALGMLSTSIDHSTAVTPGAVVLAAISLGILVMWPRTRFARVTWLSAPLVVVIVATVAATTVVNVPSWTLSAAQFVQLPNAGPRALLSSLGRPDLTALTHMATWSAAATIAIVASLETLLSLQAIDRLDPLRRHSAPDRELLAQGATNIVAGLCGGLPVTAVIVRGGANIAAGARDRLSALVHGAWLLLALLAGAPLLNRIPLAALAAILIHIGVKLCAPGLVRTQFRLGLPQFLPYIVTVGMVLATGLLEGVVAGTVCALLLAVRPHTRSKLHAHTADDGTRVVRFSHHGTFLSRPALLRQLGTVRDGEVVVFDGDDAVIDHDVKEVLADFQERAADRGIRVELRGIDLTGVHPGAGH